MASGYGQVEMDPADKDTAKKRVESILDFRLICHLHSGTKCLRTGSVVVMWGAVVMWECSGNVGCSGDVGV